MASSSRCQNNSSDPMSLVFMLNGDQGSTGEQAMMGSVTHPRCEDGDMNGRNGRSRRSARLTTRRRSSVLRVHRPPYAQEEAIFIWYLRTDLGWSWNDVVRYFEAQFPESRGKPGLQCKFYRTLVYWGVTKIRDRKSCPQYPHEHQDPGQYGVIQRTNMRFSWMLLEHQNVPCLPQFHPGSPPRQE